MNSIPLLPQIYRPMTASALEEKKADREQITTTFRPGTKAFLEQIRREKGLRSWSDALRLIVNQAHGEHLLDQF